MINKDDTMIHIIVCIVYEYLPETTE